MNARKILYGVTGSIPLMERGGIGSVPIGESKISYIVIGESYFKFKFMFLVMIHVCSQSRIHRNRGRRLVYSETLSESSCKLFF